MSVDNGCTYRTNSAISNVNKLTWHCYFLFTVHVAALVHFIIHYNKTISQFVFPITLRSHIQKLLYFCFWFRDGVTYNGIAQICINARSGKEKIAFCYLYFKLHNRNSCVNLFLLWIKRMLLYICMYAESTWNWNSLVQLYKYM